MAPPSAEETKQAANAAKLAEQGQEAVTKAKEDYTKALAEANKVAAEGNTLLEEESRLEQALIEEKQKAIEVGKAQQKLNQKLIKQMNLMNGISKDQREKQKNKIASTKALIELEKLKLESIAQNSQEMKGNLEIVKKATDAQRKFGVEVEESIDAGVAKVNTISGALTKFASQIPIIGGALGQAFSQKKNMNDMGDQLTEISSNMPDGKFGKGATDSLGKMFSGMGVLSMASAGLAFQLAGIALELDGLSKGIGKATGFGNEFNATLLKGHKQTMMSGVSMREFAGAFTALATGFSGFNPTAHKTNQYLAATTSQLEKIGVSTDSSTKLMDHFHRAMGLSQKASADMTAQLVMMGKQAGITAAKMASDFQASAGRLAIYGKNNIKVFKQLAAQAKATGLEMGTLLKISTQFDTFDGAAESVSNLNAVLGTQLSTLEMMAADGPQKIKMMKEQIQASVGNFDSLDKFTKMYVAQAMGVNSVDEAQRLLNMSQAESAALAQKQQEQADIQKELATATAELVPMIQKLKIAGMKLIMSLSPMITGFTQMIMFVDWLFVGLAELTGGVDEFGVGMTLLQGILITFGVMVGLSFGYITGPIALIMMLATAIGTVFDIIHKTGSKSIAGGLFNDIAKTIVDFGLSLLNPITYLRKFKDGFSSVWETIHKPGSKSIAGGLFDKTIGKSLSALGSDAQAAGSDLDGLSGKMDGLYDTTHKGPGNSFDIQAMASLDTTAIAAGFNKIKSAVMELSNIKMDGFLAMHTDGSETSFIMGSDGLIKSISEGKLVVDVKMPEFKLPEVLVKVFIGDRELRAIVEHEIKVQKGNEG